MKLLLPRLRTEAVDGATALRPPDRPGVWTHRDRALHSVGGTLDVGGGVESEELTSLPTIWARPLLFGQALFDRAHPAHASIVSEWRGLLSLIAMSEEFGYLDRLSLKQESIPESSDIPLLQALYRLRPNEDWRRLTLIVFDGHIVGASSPSSLLFTPAAYRIEGRNRGYPMIDARRHRLVDPVSYYRSNPEYIPSLRRLSSWVSSLQNGLDDVTHPSTDVNKLSAALDRWLDDMSELVGSHSGIVTRRGLFTVRVANRPGPLGSYEYERTEFQSDLLLDTRRIRREFGPDEQVPIIVDTNKWAEGGRLSENRSAAHVDVPGGLEGTDLDGGAIQHRWLNPRHCFTTTLVETEIIKRSTFCPGDGKYLLPLNEHIFKILTPEDIEEFLSIDASNFSVGVIVTLRVPLHGGGEAVFEKRYSPEDITRLQRAPIAIWPDFRSSVGWPSYFVFWKTMEDITCHPYPSSDPPKQEERFKINLSVLPQPPVAIMFERRDEPVGLILPRFRSVDAPAREKETWAVGIDFGTTNTSLSIRAEGTAKVSELKFADRVLPLSQFDPGENLALNAVTELTGFFLPPKDIALPFPSVIGEMFPNENVEPRPVEDGVILFVNLPIYQDYLQTYMNRGLFSELKWWTTNLTRGKVNVFLAQVALMAAAELRAQGVKSANLVWSYPSAFRRTQVDFFNNIWQRLVTLVWRPAGIQLHSIEARTESVAVCSYAREIERARVGANSPTITIDIGGGTSDICIWAAGRVKAQTSVRGLAGNVLTETVENIQQLQSDLVEMAQVSANAREEVLERLKRKKKDLAVYMNLFFHEYSEKLANSFVLTGMNMPSVKRFRSVILALLGGLSYVTGVMLRCIARDLDPEDGCSVLFAGNGAKSWNLLTEPTLIPTWSTFIARGWTGSDSKGIRCALSVAPKTEVSKGLVCEVLPQDPEAKARMFVGEQGIRIDGVDGRELTECDDLLDVFPDQPELSMHKVPELIIPKELPNLAGYVDAYEVERDKFQLESLRPHFSVPRIRSFIEDELQRAAHERETAPMPILVLGIRGLLDDFIRAPLEQ